jgi:hypothetical protein
MLRERLSTAKSRLRDVRLVLSDLRDGRVPLFMLTTPALPDVEKAEREVEADIADLEQAIRDLGEIP